MPIRHIGIIAIITAIGIIDIGTGGNSYWGQIAMPWTAEDAERHTKKADSPKRQRMWAEIANSVLAETGDDGRAIRERLRQVCLTKYCEVARSPSFTSHWPAS